MSVQKASIVENTVSQRAIVNDEAVRLYVDKYRGFTKKSAESTIEMAKTFYEAKTNLYKTAFSVFCGEIGVDEKGATFRKLVAIGDNAPALEKHIDLLPSDWTTIYFLATLAKKDVQIFETVLTSDEYKPGLTLAKIKELSVRSGYIDKKKAKQVGDTKAGAGESEAKARMTMSIILDGLGEDAARELHAEIVSLKEKYGFKMIETKNCETLKSKTVH